MRRRCCRHDSLTAALYRGGALYRGAALCVSAALALSACGDSQPESSSSVSSSPSPGAASPDTGNATQPEPAPGATVMQAAGGEPAGGSVAPAPAGPDVPPTPEMPAAGAGSEAAMGAEQPPPAPPPSNPPGESCTGCARFFLPLTGEKQLGNFELDLPAPVDMTSTTITFRLMVVGFTSTAGGVSLYVRDAANADQGFIWTNLTALGTWTEVRLEFSGALPGGTADMGNRFDRTKVAKIGVQVNSADTFAGATWQTTVVYLDSVRFSNSVTPDLTFDADIGDFALIGAAAPAGSGVSFVGP